MQHSCCEGWGVRKNGHWNQPAGMYTDAGGGAILHERTFLLRKQHAHINHEHGVATLVKIDTVLELPCLLLSVVNDR